MSKTESMTKPGIMKANNRRQVLDLIRRYSCSRLDIAAMSSLSRSSVTNIVNELIGNGLVVEKSFACGFVGRHPVNLYIVENARLILGVCLSKDTVSFGLVNLGSKILCQSSAPIDDAPQSVISAIHTQYLAWIDLFNVPAERILGIGIIAPSPLDPEAGTVCSPVGTSAWQHVNLVQQFSKLFSMPAYLEEETDMLALEEKFFGLAQNLENFALLKIDNSVSSGLIMHDRLYRGAHGIGCEIGHMSIRHDGSLCRCGSRGCLETLLSNHAIAQNTVFADWQSLLIAAEQGNENAISSMAPLVDYLTIAPNNIFHLLHVEHVLFMGDVATHSDGLLHSLEHSIRTNSPHPQGVEQRRLLVSKRKITVSTAAMAYLNVFYTAQR